jgi:hypothetical protein
MTQQNIHQEIESERAMSEFNNAESKQGSAAKDTQVQGQPREEKGGFFEKYCNSHPAASQCRVYDL